jgi:acetylornithine deacetylase/succinyl-diaminopimelate desuccinylase-like protein
MSDHALSAADLTAYANGSREGYEQHLRELVEIPSVSNDPARKDDVRRAAVRAAELVRWAGGDADVLETGGHPMVHGRIGTDPRLPTVTVYNHIDVQPADEPQWRSDPFRLTIEGERYVARGTTDDKGPALAALYGARYAAQHGVAANIHFLWELEEEIGSPHFAAAITRERSRLATGSVIVSDTVWVSRSRPACPAGLRGLQGFRLSLRTGETDQHSGTTGGAARNPVAEMCEVVASLLDARTGRVKIKEFYDDVVKPSRAELEDLKRCGFTVAGFKKDHLFHSLRSDDALDVMKRLWLQPTLEVHGIAGGYQGPGVKTVVPPEATAILSCRLVPDMNPARIVKLVREHVRKVNPDVRVQPEHALPAYAGRTTGPYADAVRAAMKAAFGKEPVFVREGGSIGAVLAMEKILAAPVYFLGLSLPEHGYHAPNENFDWRQARGGMVAFARYFERVARLPQARPRTSARGRGPSEERSRARAARSTSAARGRDL